MSIMALIQNARDEREQCLSVPVASEKVFKNKWTPIIDDLKLQWLSLFSTGVDIIEIDLSQVLIELNMFKSSYIEKYGSDEVVDRVDLLINFLKEAFYRPGVKVFVG